MRITRIIAWQVDLPLHEGSYKWSGGKSVTVFDSTVIAIETDAGITGYGSYLPYNRLQRAALGAGKGERAVASYDEDSVSMAVEAGRDAVRGARDIDTLLFATTSPPYAEKLNAATIAAALDLPATVRTRHSTFRTVARSSATPPNLIGVRYW